MEEKPVIKREATKFTKEMRFEEPEMFLYATVNVDNVSEMVVKELGAKFISFWNEAQNIIKKSVSQ